MDRPSIYEFAGGDEAFLALAAAVTERCIADPELNHPFAGRLSPRHNENLAAYWAEVFGGPPSYSRALGGHSAMLEIHAGHGAPLEWGDRFEACFIAALDDAELPQDREFRQAMHDYIHWATREVNEYAPAGATVEPGHPMPHWSWAGLVTATAWGTFLQSMPRIKMVEEGEATGPLAEIYATSKARSVAGVVPEILRTMSLRPDFLRAIDEASRLHFSDGALTRAQHEMIASYVSALSRCRYWLSSHTWFLQLQGEQFGQAAQALRDGDLDAAGLDRPERLLLEFTGTITGGAYRVTDEQVQQLREVGWSDEQIAEAAYDAALFNLFVRLADTFGIEPPALYEPEGIPGAVSRP